MTHPKVFFTGMAAQVEVQTGEVGRTGVGRRLHLSPLADSIDKSLTEAPSNTQGSLIITPESSKPVPAPKPRLTPKPFAVEKTPTIRPILAPKPNTKPRPEPTRPTSYKSDPPNGPKPQQPNVTSKHRPVSTNHSRPAPTSYKPSPKLSTGQTTKPVAQPFKPAPLTLGDPSKPTPSQPVGCQKPAAAGLSHSQSPKKPPSVEWSGSTKQEKECGKTASSIRAGGAYLTRAKSMGFLRQIGLEREQRKEDEGPEVTVQLRTQSTGSRPRPVSAIFLPSPIQAESSTPADRWVGRRPLSADLTSKFESIGLSLHRGCPAKTGSKENTPEEGALLRRREGETGADGTIVTPQALDSKPSALARGSEKKKEEEKDEGKGGGSIKRRISLLLDSSSSSPVVPYRVAAQGPEPHSPVQPVLEADVPLGGVKQRIKKLTEDTVTPPAQTPAVKPRPLPPDLTKRFGSEKSTDLGSPSPSEATDRHESDTDPQRRRQDSVFIFSDQRKVVEDTRGSKEQPTQTSSDPSAGRTAARRGLEIEAQESHPSSGVQTVRAALFENVVERHSVLVMEDRAQSNTKSCPKRSVSLKLGDGEKGGSLVTSPYRKPVSPSSPLRVEHLFDTVHAVGERRAVSESVPSAQLEDKAMTLRSRHSEGNRPARAEAVEERPARVQGDLSSAQRGAPASQREQGPRYLRVGALQKWNTAEVDRGAEVEKGRQMEKERHMERERKEEEKERQREAERRMQMAVEREKPREQDREREEVAAPKRLKMLEADEQPPKPRATYFALTGQIQEVISHGDEGIERGDMEVPFDDFSVMSGQCGSQGKGKGNPSVGKAFGKSSQGQEQEEELMERKQTQERKRGTAWDRKTGIEEMEIEKQKQVLEKVRELEREKERQRERKEFDREKQRPQQRELERECELERERECELERENQCELERERQRELERERQRELERERQRELERERQLERERRRELERQCELERERQRELERERQRELERERQLERERRRELERQCELEREKQCELERERQRELERERQRELERERQRELERQKEFKERQRQFDLERQKKLERQRLEELEVIKEMERRQLFRFEKQKQAERERQQLLELEKQILREKMEREEQEKMRQQAIQQELEWERELENQRGRQSVEEFEIIKDLERRQLFEKQNERERQPLQKQRLREKMEKEEQEKMRQVARQQEAERQKILERQRKENQERGVLDSLPLRPKVLDLDSVSLGDQHSRGSPHSPGARWKQPFPRGEDHYRPGILDIDSFRSQTQTQPSPTREVFPIAGIKGSDPGSGVRSHTPEREVSRRVGAVGRPSPVWAPSQQELWEQRLGFNEESVDRPMAGPEPPRKPANKPSLEQLLHRQLDRATAPILVPERRWSGMPGEPSFPRREPHSPGSPMEQTWFPQDSEPQGHRVEARGQRRSQGSQELNRMRSRSVSRRSAPSESAVEGTLSRMRSRSAHRERGRQSWEQLKQSVDGEEEGRDIDTLVHETDSQYGTWETGLRTDDSLTPATPTSDSNFSQLPRKPIPPHTPGEHAPHSDLDTPDGFFTSVQPEMQLLPFPEASTILLDSSALRSRVQLSKMRGPRSLPSRVARQTAAMSVHPEGQTAPTEDWRSRDSTEDNIESSKQEDSDSEEQERGADPRSAAASSQPQRVALFPGMDPSALKFQLKKRRDSENQTDGAAPSPSQLSRSPKSPFLPRASRVLPPSGGKENGEEASPQWLRELKSKKRSSQYENDS